MNVTPSCAVFRLPLGRGGVILRGENQILLLRKVLLILGGSGIIMSLGRIKGDTRGEIPRYKADRYDKSGHRCDYPSKGWEPLLNACSPRWTVLFTHVMFMAVMTAKLCWLLN